ncbi:hypothetical protein ES705_25591 [subsurface metagenome]
MENKTLKIILTGNYEDAQIRALLPSFILTQENQNQKSKIKNRTDFDILDYKIQTDSPEYKEVIVKWRPKN